MINDMDLRLLENTSAGNRYKKMKKGIDENEHNIYDNKKQFRHNAHYQADYSKMKDEILYEKFVTRGGLMQQS